MIPYFLTNSKLKWLSFHRSDTIKTTATDTAGELPTNDERSDVAGRRGPIYRALEGDEASAPYSSLAVSATSATIATTAQDPW